MCKDRCCCALIFVISLIVGAVVATLFLFGIIVPTPALWGAFIIGIVGLIALIVLALLSACSDCRLKKYCESRVCLIAGVIGTLVFSLIALAIPIAATIAVAVIIGLLTLFVTITVIALIGLIYEISNCQGRCGR